MSGPVREAFRLLEAAGVDREALRSAALGAVFSLVSEGSDARAAAFAGCGLLDEGIWREMRLSPSVRDATEESVAAFYRALSASGVPLPSEPGSMNVWTRSVPVADALADAGFDFSRLDESDSSVAHGSKSAELLRWLAARGLRFSNPDYSGSTPLHSAADAEAATVLLRDHGCGVNHRASDGSTPLHQVFRLGVNFDDAQACALASVLLDAGADPNLVDENGATPLCRAAARRFPDACRLLVDAGASAAVGYPLAFLCSADNPFQKKRFGRMRFSGWMQGLFDGETEEETALRLASAEAYRQARKLALRRCAAVLAEAGAETILDDGSSVIALCDGPEEAADVEAGILGLVG